MRLIFGQTRKRKVAAQKPDRERERAESNAVP